MKEHFFLIFNHNAANIPSLNVCRWHTVAKLTGGRGRPPALGS